RQKTTERALSESGFDRLLLHSGLPFTYFEDDNDAPFHPTPHFAHWAPVEGPSHLLEVVPGRKARLVRVMPRDFWYEPPAAAPDFVRDALDVEDVATPEEAWAALKAPAGAKTAFIGNATQEAEANGVAKDAVNARSLVARLDWERSYKSDYEASTMAEATARAAAGFKVAEELFKSGASEIEIHHAYLAAVGQMEEKLPYATINGLDERASTLHYHGKRGKEASPGQVMLIDAGASVRGYGCDITRTYATTKAHPVFKQLLGGMESIQRALAAAATPGKPYLDLHVDAHRKIAGLLAETGVLRVRADEAFEKGYTRPFFPHGLGHFLGIQVHDVAGKYADKSGTPAPPPAQHPYLRTTRTIEERQLFTIEPGLYFIPMLLEPFRGNGGGGAFDWDLIDRLTPCGGIRIEDDVLVLGGGNRNFTREVLPN
ncbi:MAG TPA: Xaa-Pro dipeptidase, partial [Thermoanaerobaculia bacterium]|nr:Xaa-Pro dipeptidase [Thermoanaerobaculia bacterium]